MPTKLVTVELGKPLPKKIERAEDYDRVWVIIMRYGIPVMKVNIYNYCTPIFEEQLRSEIVRQTGQTLVGNEDYMQRENIATAVGLSRKVPSEFLEEPELADLLPDLKPRTGRRFSMSIVVCTRDRPEDLRMCLNSLIKLESGHHRLELIVVDNNPASGQTKPIVREFQGVRYETESRPGVACARNKGLKVAQSDIVAYIDDDVDVPPHWPVRILAPFVDDRVMCVTGLVLPLELETRSQEMFEKYGGLGRGYIPRIFGKQFFNLSGRYAIHIWNLGGTANAAIRKSVIPQTGMFDQTLGPGLPTGVGEDIYMFYRILKFGHICYYEPAAYVWHKHRRDMQSLSRQIYNYNKGQTSYQLRTLVSDGDKRAIWQMLWDLPKWHFRRIFLILIGQYKYPLCLLLQEILGNIVGPYAFYKAVKMHSRQSKVDANPIKSSVPMPSGVRYVVRLAMRLFN